MNTSKAVWVKRPKGTITTLHSYRFTPDQGSEVYFILGDDGKIELKAEGEGWDFALFHTPNDWILFEKESVKINFNRVKETIKATRKDSLRVEKSGTMLSFFYEDEEPFLTLSFDAIRNSAAIGIKAKGDKELYVEVF